MPEKFKIYLFKNGDALRVPQVIQIRQSQLPGPPFRSTDRGIDFCCDSVFHLNGDRVISFDAFFDGSAFVLVPWNECFRPDDYNFVYKTFIKNECPNPECQERRINGQVPQCNLCGTEIKPKRKVKPCKRKETVYPKAHNCVLEEIKAKEEALREEKLRQRERIFKRAETVGLKCSQKCEKTRKPECPQKCQKRKSDTGGLKCPKKCEKRRSDIGLPKCPQKCDKRRSEIEVLQLPKKCEKPRSNQSLGVCRSQKLETRPPDLCNLCFSQRPNCSILSSETDVELVEQSSESCHVSQEQSCSCMMTPRLA